MSTGQYLLGGAAGLVFGLLVAAGNTLLNVGLSFICVYIGLAAAKAVVKTA